MESILTSIKKLVGIAESDTSFDTDLIIHINSVLAILTQVGVGPSDGFCIEDDGATWFDFIRDDKRLAFAKTYVYAKTKLVFDPPQSSAHMEALKEIIKETEWRLHVATDPIA